MAGSSSGSNSQHNSSSSSSFSAAGGRERAIEALIDREPQGDYYRAARVIVRSYVVIYSIYYFAILMYAHTRALL